jgi:hypothetical protein
MAERFVIVEKVYELSSGNTIVTPMLNIARDNKINRDKIISLANSMIERYPFDDYTMKVLYEVVLYKEDGESVIIHSVERNK